MNMQIQHDCYQMVNLIQVGKLLFCRLSMSSIVDRLKIFAIYYCMLKLETHLDNDKLQHGYLLFLIYVISSLMTRCILFGIDIGYEIYQ